MIKTRQLWVRPWVVNTLTFRDTPTGLIVLYFIWDIYIYIYTRAGPAVKLTCRVPAIKLEPLGAQCYWKHCWNRAINARMHNHVSLLQSRSQRLETSRHHIVLDLEKVKPLFFLFLFCGAIFKFGFASQSPHVTLVLPQTQHATKRANQAAMAATLCA